MSGGAIGKEPRRRRRRTRRARAVSFSTSSSPSSDSGSSIKLGDRKGDVVPATCRFTQVIQVQSLVCRAEFSLSNGLWCTQVHSMFSGDEAS